jgi:hypothetical protein
LIHRRLTAAWVAISFVLGVVTPTAAHGASAPRCNGTASLCARTIGEVAFATTHNSMASSADRFRPPNQRRTMEAQLEHGIRGFQIDAYFGTPRGSRVYTDLSGPLGNAAELSPKLVTAATLVHRRLGAPPAGTPYDVYLCHVFCELGAVRMVDELRVVREFLDSHPREVVVMVIEDYVPPDRLMTVFDDAGLASMLLPVEPGAPLPTLGQMIDAGTRLQVSLENGDGGPRLPNAFSGLVEETPFTFLRPRHLEAASSCATNRGTTGALLFQFNHWVTPAEPVTAPRVNSTLLHARIARCTEARRAPTLVAVDFAEQGDVLGVVRRLNR